MKGKLKGIRGEVLTFKADPFVCGASECYDHYEDGLVVMCDGLIVAVGNYAATAAAWPGLTDIDVWNDSLIMPGFVDCHVHYVQSPMVGSYGDTLLKWLNQYVFPVESRYRDKDYAREVARMFFRQTLSHGTTTANVFATTFEESVDALFEESERYNACTIAGKVLQDRNLPDNLRDSDAGESVAVSERLLLKWHGRGRQLYAVIPRFAPTSTPEQLRLAGGLYQKYLDRGVYMHTHLDEAEGEIEWVKSLFPEARDYTDVYDRYGLVGPRSVMAHCCIVEPREWQRLYEAECGVVHCPSSNLFLGDGEFRYWEAKDAGRPCRVGIGSDIGGGTSFSLVRQLGEAYKVGMLRGHALDAMRSYYMATLGGARALHLDDRVGALRAGMEADIVVLDMKPDEFIEWRMREVESVFDRLFILQTLAPDRLVHATYVAGKKVYDREIQKFQKDIRNISF
ncbi:guanine deaminase [Muribaculaceae bacterium Isolate-110 (HZI)]|nr:guanine deaminase [Muribaculaceae bacterium Isolate-110 (HZI)]